MSEPTMIIRGKEAVLIAAAAPQLLEACEDAHEKLHECTAVLSANDCADVADTMAQLRIAIAKARGEA